MKTVFFFFGLFTGVFALLLVLGFVTLKHAVSSDTVTITVQVKDFPKAKEATQTPEPPKPATRACKGKGTPKKRQDVALVGWADPDTAAYYRHAGIDYSQTADIPGSVFDYRK